MARDAVAAIDIGTNSVRLLITDADGGELERHMEITRLGQGVDDSGQLAAEAVARTIEVLRRYAQLLEKHDVAALRMTATSAARDASNRDEFFAQVRSTTGKEPELLSGAAEAQLSFAGATAGLAEEGETNYVIFDIGGGSTEFARGRQTPESYLSLDIGSVRMTERFLRQDPPDPSELAAATKFIHGELDRVAAQVAPLPEDTWVGLAGTVTSFAAHATGVTEYDASKTHGLELSRDAILDFASELCTLPCEQRRQRLMEPKRADVIAGGALIFSCIVEHFGLSVVRCSERDILDGLAASQRATIA